MFCFANILQHLCSSLIKCLMKTCIWVTAQWKTSSVKWIKFHHLLPSKGQLLVFLLYPAAVQQKPRDRFYTGANSAIAESTKQLFLPIFTVFYKENGTIPISSLPKGCTASSLSSSSILEAHAIAEQAKPILFTPISANNHLHLTQYMEISQQSMHHSVIPPPWELHPENAMGQSAYLMKEGRMDKTKHEMRQKKKKRKKQDILTIF